MVGKLEWLGDDGPLVLLADAEADGWLGLWREATKQDPANEVETWAGKRMIMDVDVDEDDPTTDYARACTALEEPAVAATVWFEGGVALAFETSGHQATIVKAGDDVVVAKWIFASTEAHAAEVLSTLPSDLVWDETDVIFELKKNGVRLHPAASRTEADVPTLPFALSAGRYAVATTLFEPDEDSSFELFRLRRVR
ncbi:MAG: hypothetical protein H6722_12625 [Sandaracinus sp.]|nr:hypothetical protein [Sandaracinus sp.]MCB9624250.1 hypothetical protein [Sandaracinus sp.]